MLALAVFPALSIAVALMVCRPVAVAVLGEGQVRTPDSASEQVKVTTALVALMIPFAPGAGETEALMSGGVRSMFTVAVAFELLPSLSVAVPEADCPAPSWVNVLAGLQAVTPERASEQLKLTVTFVLFQPELVGAGVRTG